MSPGHHQGRSQGSHSRAGLTFCQEHSPVLSTSTTSLVLCLLRFFWGLPGRRVCYSELQRKRATRPQTFRVLPRNTIFGCRSVLYCRTAARAHRATPQTSIWASGHPGPLSAGFTRSPRGREHESDVEADQSPRGRWPQSPIAGESGRTVTGQAVAFHPPAWVPMLRRRPLSHRQALPRRVADCLVKSKEEQLPPAPPGAG